MFAPPEIAAAKQLLAAALQEDLNTQGDVTSLATIPAELNGRVAFVARSPGVLAGWPSVRLTLQAMDATLSCQEFKHDGEHLVSGDRIALVEGSMRSILQAERTALNFLQHLSGVATLTRKYVDAIAGHSAKILDTRKTIPGWRLLDKYAVRMGGGTNHRIGLYDGILIKDNHLAALSPRETAIAQAIESARRTYPHLPIEVEVDSLQQLEQALACRPNIVLLDNMNLDDLRAAVARRNAVAPAVQLEASGGVNLLTVRDIAATGVDRISVGALTHSAAALDIALDYLA